MNSSARVSKKALLEHAIYNSDNLKFLQTHQHTYEQAIDFIYIDPVAHLDKGFKATPAANQKWVEGMRVRLTETLPFLKDEGVMTVSVDDKSLPHLRILMDEVFGEQNFIGMVVVDNGNVHNNARFLSISHEYLLVYAKNLIQLTKSDIRWRQQREGLSILRKKEQQLRKQHGTDYAALSEELKIWLKDQPFPKRMQGFFNADKKGLYTYSDLSAPGIKLTYPVIHPITKKPVALPSRGWGLTEDNFKQLIEHDLIIWGETEAQQPLKKLYLKDTPDQVIRGLLHYPSRTPTQLLKRILGENLSFDNPKNLDYIKYLIEVMSPDNAVVLDYFAGSGTTGHAVLDLNYEKPESNRTFILVNNNEKQVFTQVLKPRLEAVISGKWADRQHRPRKATLKVL